jgi:hypothetical protein
MLTASVENISGRWLKNIFKILVELMRIPLISSTLNSLLWFTI